MLGLIQRERRTGAPCFSEVGLEHLLAIDVLLRARVQTLQDNFTLNVRDANTLVECEHADKKDET